MLGVPLRAIIHVTNQECDQSEIMNAYSNLNSCLLENREEWRTTVTNQSNFSCLRCNNHLLISCTIAEMHYFVCLNS